MSDRLVGMIDAGFLREAGARALRMRLEDIEIQPNVIIDWLDRCAARLNARLLRCYWYDAIVQAAGNSPKYVEQRKMLDLIEETPGMQTRLGSLSG